MADTGTADLLVLSSPGFPGVMMLGPAGRAVASGPEAVTGNPALMIPGFTAAGGRWNLQTTGVSAAGGFRAGGSLLIGSGISYLGRGGIIRRDDAGQVTGEYSYDTGAAFAGASYSLTQWLRAGLAAGVAWENIDQQSGTGVTASAGVAAEIGSAGTAGLAVTGLGSAPSWNGVSKAMPVEISAGLQWELGEYFNCFGGGSFGFSTSSSLGAGLCFCQSQMQLTAGYGYTPDEDELTGFFAGLQYTYVSGGTYIIEAAVAQRDQLEWPVMAGISIRL